MNACTCTKWACRKAAAHAELHAANAAFHAALVAQFGSDLAALNARNDLRQFRRQYNATTKATHARFNDAWHAFQSVRGTGMTRGPTSALPAWLDGGAA